MTSAPVPEDRVKVTLFKSSGKWYTDELWKIPERAIGPWDMIHSPDFHRIDFGPILITEEGPWGYPHLLRGCKNVRLDCYSLSEGTSKRVR